MSHEENSKSEIFIDKTIREQISNLNNYAHNEIAKLYNYIDQSIKKSIQKKFQSILETNLHLNNIEQEFQQQIQLTSINFDSIKQQIKELKSKINNDNNIVEEKVTANSQEIIRMSKIIDSKNTLFDTNYFEDLKCEMKKLKEILTSDHNSSTQSHENIASQISEINSIQPINDQISSDFIQEENHKIKTNLTSIKSEIKRIISKALGQDDEVEKNNFDDLQIELDETSRKDIQYELETNNQPQIKEQIRSITKPSEQQISCEQVSSDNNAKEIIEKVNQIISNNEQLKNDFDSFKSEILNMIQTSKNNAKDVQHKIMESTLISNDANSNSIEANSNAFVAKCKADEAVFKAAEAESHAIFANEKADRIVSDNDKMNVDIRCLKYEVKKLRAKVKELEESKINESSIHEEFQDKLDQMKSQIKYIKSDFKKFKEEKQQFESNKQNSITNDDFVERVDKAENRSSKAISTANDAQTKATNAHINEHKAENKLVLYKEENQTLRNEIKSLKTDIKKFKNDLVTTQLVAIPEDFVQTIQDAQIQSTKAYDKAKKAHKESKELINLFIEKLYKLKTDVHLLKSEIKKIRESTNIDENAKSQKNDIGTKKIN